MFVQVGMGEVRGALETIFPIREGLSLEALRVIHWIRDIFLGSVVEDSALLLDPAFGEAIKKGLFSALKLPKDLTFKTERDPRSYSTIFTATSGGASLWVKIPERDLVALDRSTRAEWRSQLNEAIGDNRSLYGENVPVEAMMDGRGRAFASLQARDIADLHLVATDPPASCECGALRAGTTHSHWCPARISP